MKGIKTKSNRYFLFTSLLFLTSITNAQVGIGTNSPNSSSVLDLSSTNKGFLPPRETSAERNAIASPIAGLTIWCTDCGPSGEMQVYNGICWTNMVGGPRNDIAIGDLFGGGKVAYIYQLGEPGYIAGEIHGFIVTLNDQDALPGWGCPFLFVGGTSTLLNTGLANTFQIINNCILNNCAARKCADLVENGYDDWYLPSKDELNKLYLNNIAIGNLADESYWSSSEVDENNGYSQNLIQGFQDVRPKNDMLLVRAIRAF